MRPIHILSVVAILPGCLNVYHHPDCEVDKQTVDWEDVTALGIPMEQFEAFDVSGTYDGEYDEGMGPVGVDLTFDPAAGKPAWITSTKISHKKRTFGIGNSIPHMIVTCPDGLELPTVMGVTTDDAQLDIRAVGTTFVPLEPQYTTYFLGESEFEEATLPEWNLQYQEGDELWARAEATLYEGVLESGTAGWMRRVTHKDDPFGSYTRTVSFTGPE